MRLRKNPKSRNQEIKKSRNQEIKKSKINLRFTILDCVIWVKSKIQNKEIKKSKIKKSKNTKSKNPKSLFKLITLTQRNKFLNADSSEG